MKLWSGVPCHHLEQVALAWVRAACVSIDVKTTRRVAERGQCGSNAISSLLKNSQTEMSVPPEASGSLKKVGQTFLSGRDSMFFNRLPEQLAR